MTSFNLRLIVISTRSDSFENLDCVSMSHEVKRVKTAFCFHWVSFDPIKSKLGVPVEWRDEVTFPTAFWEFGVY